MDTVPVAVWEQGPLRALVPLTPRNTLAQAGIEYAWVAGVIHHLEAAQDSAFAPGQRLTLQPEPSNPDDPEAVAVMDASRTKTAGYVPRSLAVRLGREPATPAVVIAEGRQEGHRVALAMLVSSRPFELRAEDRPADEVQRFATQMPRLRLPARATGDPMAQMKAMAAWLGRRSEETPPPDRAR